MKGIANYQQAMKSLKIQQSCQQYRYKMTKSARTRVLKNMRILAKKEDNDGIKIHSNHGFKRAFASILVSCENLGIVGVIDEAQQIRSLSVLLKNFVRQC